MSGKYTVVCEWNYRTPEPYEKCCVYHTTKEHIEYDGYNWCGKSDGITLNVYDSLEEALVEAHFRPEHIEYVDFTEEERGKVSFILEKYEWNQNVGLIKRGDNIC